MLPAAGGSLLQEGEEGSASFFATDMFQVKNDFQRKKEARGFIHSDASLGHPVALCFCQLLPLHHVLSPPQCHQPCHYCFALLTAGTWATAWKVQGGRCKGDTQVRGDTLLAPFQCASLCSTWGSCLAYPPIVPVLINTASSNTYLEMNTECRQQWFSTMMQGHGLIKHNAHTGPRVSVPWTRTSKVKRSCTTRLPPLCCKLLIVKKLRYHKCNMYLSISKLT